MCVLSNNFYYITCMDSTVCSRSPYVVQVEAKQIFYKPTNFVNLHILYLTSLKINLLIMVSVYGLQPKYTKQYYKYLLYHSTNRTTSSLLHKPKAKPRTSVNTKDILQVYCDITTYYTCYICMSNLRFFVTVLYKHMFGTTNRYN